MNYGKGVKMAYENLSTVVDIMHQSVKLHSCLLLYIIPKIKLTFNQIQRNTLPVNIKEICDTL